MKALPISAAAAIAVCALSFANHAHSQAQITARTPLQRLQELSLKNKQLIETQTATIKKLEDLELQSQQLKFMGRRT